jgi:hypothetical protein
MKALAIIIFVVGLAMTVYTGFTYVTEEEVLEVGDVEITNEEEHTTDWSPLVGVGIMAIGGSLLIVSIAKKA